MWTKPSVGSNATAPPSTVTAEVVSAADAQRSAANDLLGRPGRAGIDIARVQGARRDAVADLALAQDHRLAELVPTTDDAPIAAKSRDLGRAAATATARRACHRTVLDHQGTVPVEGALDIGGLADGKRLCDGRTGESEGGEEEGGAQSHGSVRCRASVAVSTRGCTRGAIVGSRRPAFA